jgi:hypothetical protein
MTICEKSSPNILKKLSNRTCFGSILCLFVTITGKNKHRLYLAENMDDERTMEQDWVEVPWGETMEREDVIEAPAREVWLGSQQNLRVGTASDGLSFGHLVWPKSKYVLRIETKDLRRQFPGRKEPENSILTGRMGQAKLSEANLDCLLIDGLQANWVAWLKDRLSDENPKVIVWMVPNQLGLCPIAQIHGYARTEEFVAYKPVKWRKPRACQETGLRKEQHGKVCGSRTARVYTFGPPPWMQ